MNAASTSRAARGARERLTPDATRWSARAPSHTPFASATTDAKGSVPSTPSAAAST